MGIGVTELLVVLAIVILIFGTKRLATIGGDLGAAIRNFKTAVKDDSEHPERKLNDSSEKVSSKAPSRKDARAEEEQHF